MQKISILFPSVLSLAAVGLLISPASQADPIKKATTVTFGAPTEIPGMVLPAGTYVMKVPDPYTHSDMVGFYDPNESHLYKLVRTVPAYRNFLVDRTVITFQERAAGAPEAINQWFYPDDNWGRQFVYPKVEVAQIAEVTPPPPPPAPAAIAPVAQQQEQQQEQQEQTEIAQNTPPPAPAQPPAAEEANPPAPSQPAASPSPELPQTASDLPLLLGFGSLLLVAGLCLRLRRGLVR